MAEPTDTPISFRDFDSATVGEVEQLLRAAKRGEAAIDRRAANFDAQHKAVMQSLGRWQWSQRRSMAKKLAQVVIQRAHLGGQQAMAPVHFAVRAVLILLAIAAIFAVVLVLAGAVGWLALQVLGLLWSAFVDMVF